MSGEDDSYREFGPFRLHAADRRLFRGKTEVEIAPKALDLLVALIAGAGRLMTREELLVALWPKTIVGEHNLTSNLYQLRKALGDEGPVSHYIQTVRGHGYRFIAPVTMKGEAPNTDPQPAPDPPHWRGIRTRLGVAVVTLIVIAAGVSAWRLIAGSSASSPVPVIAVLPFNNLSADKSNPYLTSGIRDTILTQLASIGSFRVISRVSSEAYADHPQDLKTVAQQLGASALLTGSVQKAGDRVQINVQLVDARTDTHIWAATYNRRLEDLFAIEGDVAAQVASALKMKLLPGEAARLKLSPTRDSQAYLLFLKANQYANQTFDQADVKDPVASVNAGIALYQQAIARDPRFALAYAHLSLLESFAYWFEIDPSSQRIAAAEDAAKWALALDPQLPQAHLAMGYVQYYGHQDYEAALAQFQQVVQSLPYNADVAGAMAYIYRRQGKWQDALAGLAHAARLDPRNPRWPDEIGTTLVALRRYPEALQSFAEALAIEPNDYDAATDRITALFLSGQIEQANQALAQLPGDADPQGTGAALRFEAAWLARRPDRALAALVGAPAQIQGQNTVGEMPKSLLQAEAWRLQGDTAQARKACAEARNKLQELLRAQSENPDPWAALGLAEAGLEERDAAIRAGGRAMALFPISKDAMAGPLYLAVLAKIHARLGESGPTVHILRQLLAMPAGRFISVPLLELDPIWDPIRKDAGFQALLKP